MNLRQFENQNVLSADDDKTLRLIDLLDELEVYDMAGPHGSMDENRNIWKGCKSKVSYLGDVEQRDPMLMPITDLNGFLEAIKPFCKQDTNESVQDRVEYLSGFRITDLDGLLEAIKPFCKQDTNELEGK
ncbi:hypothetical protein [Endozoicomonas sp. ALB032]|uniref:hypothetical protein n=1 Tax=Endozoicomonas sp. ALB032 TaxID=3403082 RepID=UPI003BB6A716